MPILLFRAGAGKRAGGSWCPLGRPSALHSSFTSDAAASDLFARLIAGTEAFNKARAEFWRAS
jgi:hypothetical protein